MQMAVSFDPSPRIVKEQMPAMRAAVSVTALVATTAPSAIVVISTS